MDKYPMYEFLYNKLKQEYIDIDTILNGYSDRYTTIRVNNIKSNIVEIKHKLDESKITYDFVPWYSDALIIKNVREDVIRNLGIYIEGKIYMQSLSSMIPVLLLNINTGESILDMAASPGSKTSQIASLASNKVGITACEVNKARMERLKYNLEKQGVTCCYPMLKDSRYIDEAFTFDKVLLDAPCSGSGTVNINNKGKQIFSQELLDKITKTQEDLLDKAINVVKTGSIVIYSTCSILKEENENIINKFIKSGRVEVVPINVDDFKDVPLLSSDIYGVLTICPDDLYEGFFVAKLKKIK